MGDSSTAHIAWGVNLADEYGELHESLQIDYDEPDLSDIDFDKVFGFSEKPPWSSKEFSWDDYPKSEHGDIRDAWYKKLHAAVPVSIEEYGNAYGTVSYALVLRRSFNRVKYSVGRVDPETLRAPNNAELNVIFKTLTAIGYEGPRLVQLLLFTYYG